MSDRSAPRSEVGATLVGTGGRRLGTVDAVFVDYLLVRSAGLVPVDLYLPVGAVTIDSPRRVIVDATPDQAYARWHRPLKSVSHD